jgi:hypothetical protein
MSVGGIVSVSRGISPTMGKVKRVLLNQLKDVSRELLRATVGSEGSRN